MFAKIRKGNGFGGCLDYITRAKQDDKPIEKRVWKILDSDGVRLADGEKDWRKRASADIERPTLTRSKIKDPCGHIALGFAPEDAHRLTDEFMTQVAKEYMEAMGIKNTPYVIVRHSDADHPHCHLMFSRVDYDGKIIKPVTNWHRNKRVCFDITERHGLTIAEDSLSLGTSKLRGAEKSRIEIRQIGHEVLKDKSITDWPTFQRRMKEQGVNVKCLWKDSDAKELEIKTLIYAKGNHSFIASKIGKNYTPTGLLIQFEANLKSRMAPTAKAAPMAPTPAAAPQPQATAISLSTPSLGSQPTDDANMVLGGGLSDDFAHFLKMHPGLSIEEAKRKFKEQQKLKAQQRRGPKMHH